MAMATNKVDVAAPRTRDQLFCLELASQAADAYFDRTWEQIEPILEGTWDTGTHEMSWCEARWFVKCAWTDCLNRGAAGQGDFSVVHAPRADAPCDPPAAR